MTAKKSIFFLSTKVRHMLGTCRQLGILTANQTYFAWNEMVNEYYALCKKVNSDEKTS